MQASGDVKKKNVKNTYENSLYIKSQIVHTGLNWDGLNR